LELTGERVALEINIKALKEKISLRYIKNLFYDALREKLLKGFSKA